MRTRFSCRPRVSHYTDPTYILTPATYVVQLEKLRHGLNGIRPSEVHISSMYDLHRIHSSSAERAHPLNLSIDPNPQAEAGLAKEAFTQS